MNGTHSPLAVALAGAAFGSVATFAIVQWVAVSKDPPASASAADAGADESASAGRAPLPAHATVDLQPVLDRLDGLQRELREMRDERAAAPGRTPAPGTSGIAVDVESLASAIDQIEQRKLEAMSDEELLRTARKLGLKGDDTAEAIRRFEMVLSHDLAPERRGAIEVELGTMQRALGTPESLAQSKRTFQGVVDKFGNDSDAGHHATYQLMWTANREKDPQRALQLADIYLNSAAMTPAKRLNGRWARARMQEAAGDLPGAKLSYQQLVGELEASGGQEVLLKDLKRRLSLL